MISIFEFDNYLEYLKNYFSSDQVKAGAKSAFAKACGMQTSYLSQILSGRTQLSLEQALKACTHLGLDSLESDYFLNAVQKARAGTQDLKDYYQLKMDNLKAEHSKLAARLSKTQRLSEGAVQKYYSAWIYSAVHVIFSLPHINTITEAAEYLREPQANIDDALMFLMSEGMIEKTNEGYKTLPANIHLSNDSPMIRQHHTNWRIQSMGSIQTNDPKDLHYSVLFTLSKADAERIRENILKVIKDNLKIVGPSEEEVMYASTMDFFKLA